MEIIADIADVSLANSGYLLPVIMIFTRMSLFVFLLPGLGEISIPVRVRLLLAILLTWLLLPSIEIPFSAHYRVSEAIFLILQQAFIGFLLGFAFRVMIFGLQITGSIISQSLSLSQIFGEGITTEPNTTLSTLFMISGIVLALTWDLHIYAFGVFADSFETFPIGVGMPVDTAAFWVAQHFASVFSFSLALAGPFVVLNFVYNLILGFVNRAMPQLMVSFVGMPAITGAGIFLLVLSCGSLLLVWLREYRHLIDGIVW